jgi:hypothetical protein
MAGYIGNKSSVTQVDGYTRAEADTAFIEDGDVVTVSGGNVGIGTDSPSDKLHVITPSFGGITVECTGATADPTLELLGASGNNWRMQADASVGDSLQFRYNNTTRVKIDSDGRVTMPYQPAFMASSMTATSGGFLRNGTVRINKGGMAYNNGAGQLTVPVSGLYRITGTAFTNASNKGVMLQVFVNGAHQYASEGFGSSGTFIYDTATVSIISELSANDYISIFVHGITTGVYGGGGGNTLIVELIG